MVLRAFIYISNKHIWYKHKTFLNSLYKNSLKDMVAQGAVMQQQQGWERPGYFLKEGIAPVQPYDFYGAYGNEINKDQRYVDELESNYTFGFPKHHELVSLKSIIIFR